MLILLILLGCVKEFKNEGIYKGRDDLIEESIEVRINHIINLIKKGEGINEASLEDIFQSILSESGNASSADSVSGKDMRFMERTFLDEAINKLKEDVEKSNFKMDLLREIDKYLICKSPIDNKAILRENYKYKI